MSSTKPPHSCRLTEEESEAIQRVAEERGEFVSVVMRRAVQHYLETNPDNMEILA